MGFFFGIFWGAYHNSIHWRLIAFLYAIGNIIEILIDTKYAFTAFAVGIFFGFYGRSYILASKIFNQVSHTPIATPSWNRAVIAVLIVMLPPVLLVLLFE